MEHELTCRCGSKTLRVKYSVIQDYVLLRYRCEKCGFVGKLPLQTFRNMDDDIPF